MGSGAEIRHPQPQSSQQGTKAREGEGQRKERVGGGSEHSLLAWHSHGQGASETQQGDLGLCPRPGLRLAEEKGLCGHSFCGRLPPPTPRSRAGAPPTPCPLHFSEFDSTVSSTLYLCSVSPSHTAFFSVCYFSSSLPLLLPPLPTPFFRSSLFASASPHRVPSRVLLFSVLFHPPFLSSSLLLSPVPRLLSQGSGPNPDPAKASPCVGDLALENGPPNLLTQGLSTHARRAHHRYRRRAVQKGRQRTQSPGANAMGGSRAPPPGPPLPTPHSLSGLRPPP